MTDGEVLRDIELVEFHDAVVDRVEIRRGGDVCIEFAHLAIYRREGPNACGVWSFRAALRISGVESFRAEARMSTDPADTLSDLKFWTIDGDPIDPTALATGAPLQPASAEMSWASGGTMTFRGGTLSLELLEPLERIDTWNAEC